MFGIKKLIAVVNLLEDLLVVRAFAYCTGNCMGVVMGLVLGQDLLDGIGEHETIVQNIKTLDVGEIVQVECDCIQGNNFLLEFVHATPVCGKSRLDALPNMFQLTCKCAKELIGKRNLFFFGS